ncbi:hypothetical protein BHE74_00006948 [Ensete ventricosum]|nr:hypothetical protein BHE74_00006948 [Ensete ventricosum]
MSRLNLKSYASSVRVALKVSESMPERLRGKIRVCFHWLASGISISDEIQKPPLPFFSCTCRDSTVAPGLPWFWISLAAHGTYCQQLGAFLLQQFNGLRSSSCCFDHSVSEFYYGKLYLFQNIFLLIKPCLLLCFLQLGVGSFIAHYFSTIVNSLLVSFGLSEELHNPVSIYFHDTVSVFIVVGVILSGAALGYWIVRKFVLSEDGTVDAGIAQFVKWAIRFTGVVFILQVCSS